MYSTPRKRNVVRGANMLKKIISSVKKITPFIKRSSSDDIEVRLPGLYIRVKRETPPDVPYEVTVVVPRAEMRRRFDEQSKKEDWELIYSSITIVHAPRHPLAGPPPKPPV